MVEIWCDWRAPGVRIPAVLNPAGPRELESFLQPNPRNPEAPGLRAAFALDSNGDFWVVDGYRAVHGDVDHGVRVLPPGRVRSRQGALICKGGLTIDASRQWVLTSLALVEESRSPHLATWEDAWRVLRSYPTGRAAFRGVDLRWSWRLEDPDARDTRRALRKASDADLRAELDRRRAHPHRWYALDPEAFNPEEPYQIPRRLAQAASKAAQTAPTEVRVGPDWIEFTLAGAAAFSAEIQREIGPDSPLFPLTFSPAALCEFCAFVRDGDPA